ncbi:MAG: ATP-binding protein, partial [Clostridia bacterium]
GKMNMVLDELFSNVVKYSGSEDLEFGVSVYPKHIAMKMQYSGELYDITKSKQPDTTLAAKDRPIGGLGLLIVKKTMDNVTYRCENGQNIVTLSKSFDEEIK